MGKVLGFGMWKERLLESALANDFVVGNTCPASERERVPPCHLQFQQTQHTD